MQKHKFLFYSMCIAVCAVLISCSSGNGPYSREYLQGVADDYLAAMVAGDPSTLTLSDSLKYTENAVEMKVGEGLWASDSLEMTDFNIFAIDIWRPARLFLYFSSLSNLWASGVSQICLN